MLPNGEIVSDEEEEYEGIPPLEEEENESSEEIPTHEEIGCLVVRKVLTTRAKEEEIEVQRDNFSTQDVISRIRFVVLLLIVGVVPM